MLPRVLFAKPYITAPVIAVDFDGTITTGRDAAGMPLDWPAIGEPNMETIERLRAMATQGWQIVIHTCRVSPVLNGPGVSMGQMAEVRRWLDEHGVPFHDVWPFPKPIADMYVDDLAVQVNDFHKLPMGALQGSWKGPRIFFVGEFLAFPTPQPKQTKNFKTEEGKFSVYDVEKDPRGRADMFTVHEDPEGYVVRNALVPEELRRKGIATDLYQRVNQESLGKTGKPLRSTQPRKLSTGEIVHELSDEAVSMWDSFVRKGLATKHGDKNYAFNAEEKVQWACLMLDYPEAFAKQVRDWTLKNVPDEALAEDGREQHVHTTVAYGIALDKDPEAIKEVVKSSVFNPKVRLGKIEKFDTNPEYDALKVGVESPDLHKLHAALEAMGLPGNTYPDYKPHMTLAYVKKGSCDHLLGQDPFGGEEFTLSNYDLSYASHDKGDHIYFKAGISRPWMIAATAKFGTRIFAGENGAHQAPMSEMDCIEELLSWLTESGHEVSTRYGTGADALPDRNTMCRGDCEGTGYVPINFKEPAPGQAYFVYSDEDERLYHDPWDKAEAENPSEDGYHFLTCPECGGTGKQKPGDTNEDLRRPLEPKGVLVANLRLWSHVEKRGDKWVVTNKDRTKTLGTHDTEEEARKQLAAIEISKHMHGALRAADFGALQKACRSLVEEDPKWLGYLTTPSVAESLGRVQEAISRSRTPEDLQRAWDEFRPSSTWEQVVAKSESKEKEPVAAALRPILFVKI